MQDVLGASIALEEVVKMTFEIRDKYQPLSVLSISSHISQNDTSNYYLPNAQGS